MSEADATRQELEMALLQADIINKLADAMLKQEQKRWEPWKLLVTGIGAAAALFGAIGVTLSYLLGRAH